jgi:hypothetical protein
MNGDRDCYCGKDIGGMDGDVMVIVVKILEVWMETVMAIVRYGWRL